MISSLARGISVNLVGTIARVIFVFFHSLLAARFFGAELYGFYAIGVAAVILLSYVSQMGFARTITRFVAQYHARGEPDRIVGVLRRVVLLSLIVSLLVSMLMGWQAEPLSHLFGEPALASSLQIFAFAVPMLSMATILAAFTQGLKKMKYKVLAVDIARPGVELLVLVALIVTRSDGVSLAVPYLVSLLVAVVLLLFFARINLAQLVASFPDFRGNAVSPPLRPLFTFAFPVLVVEILMSVTNRASILLLGTLGTAAMVGIFSIVQRVVALGSTFLTSTNIMFSPLIADLVEREEFAQLGHLYKVTTRWILIISLPYFLILLFFGHEILALFGTEFTVGTIALNYLIVATLFHLATGSSGILLMMAGYPEYSALNEIVMLVVVVSLNLLLTPTHGLLGAVWALGVGLVSVNLLRILQVWWHLRMLPFAFSWWKIIVAAGMMVLTLWIWQSFLMPDGITWYWMLVGSLVALAVFGFFVIALGLEMEETQLLRRVFDRRVKSYLYPG